MKASSLTSKNLNSYSKIAKPFENVTDPVFIQRLESAAVAIANLSLYASLNASWWIFLALILVPDLSLLAYYKNPKIGSKIYNLVHNYATPIIVGVLMLFLSTPYALEIILIWVAHIAIDRSLGYGLKYPTSFKHTHLSWK